MTKLKLLADRVAVEPSAPEETTKGGLIVPESAQKKPNKGTVYRVGPGTSDIKMTVKEGDFVLFGQHAGTEVKLEKKTLLLMRQEDIIAVI